MEYAIDLTPFYEDWEKKTKPALFQGIVVQFGRDRFVVDRWNKGDQHCFVFIDLAQKNPYKPFAKKPSEVAQMIADKKLIIDGINGVAGRVS